VLVGGLVSAMTVGDDGVQQILEDLVALLVTSNATHGHDEGVAWRAGRGPRVSVDEHTLVNSITATMATNMSCYLYLNRESH